MATVRATGTKPELKVRKFLFSKGFRYRKNVKYLPGSPDIVLPKYNTVIFINGCFWHGHKNCKNATLPKSRKEYWYTKIAKNTKRDSKQKRELTKIGWHVITIWECKIKKVLSQSSKEQLKLLSSIKKNQYK